MNKHIALGSLMIAAIFLLGCQPAPSSSNSTKIGRRARGSAATSAGANSSTASGSTSTQWGQITNQQGDQVFDQLLANLVAPQMSGSSDAALGYVSSTANQSTNVVFWGQAYMYGAAGNSSTATLNGANSRLHIEIWDSTAVQSGGTIAPFVIHIGYDNSGFVSATGAISGSSANLTFTDGFGSVSLQGNISGNYFSGTIYYSNSISSNTPLGQFTVPTCGFFVCQ